MVSNISGILKSKRMLRQLTRCISSVEKEEERDSSTNHQAFKRLSELDVINSQNVGNKNCNTLIN